MADLDEDIIYVRTINGMPPDENGNFEFIPGTCIEITLNDEENSVTISDICCTPCCGWPELKVLQEQIATLNDIANNLDMQTAQLQNAISAVSTLTKTL